MNELVFHARRLSDLNGIAAKIVKAAGQERIIAFYGQMGVGKTTLIRSICKYLGVRTEVTSPTFALVNEYPSDDGLVFHFDFYRINRISEALDFGIDEYKHRNRSGHSGNSKALRDSGHRGRWHCCVLCL